MSDIRSDKIKVGDQVRIYWEYIPNLEGEVRYVPCATGDSWSIKSPDGLIHEVQMFCRMDQIRSDTP